jgi:hypothetical protein
MAGMVANLTPYFPAPGRAKDECPHTEKQKDVYLRISANHAIAGPAPKPVQSVAPQDLHAASYKSLN